MVIVSVERCEHESIVVAHGVTGVARIVSHPERVVVCFGSDKKSVIFSHVDDAVRPCLNVALQLVASLLGELVEKVVAKPVVSVGVVEAVFKLRPRTIEEVGTINVLMDQQRNAVGCMRNN